MRLDAGSCGDACLDMHFCSFGCDGSDLRVPSDRLQSDLLEPSWDVPSKSFGCGFICCFSPHDPMPGSRPGQ